MTDKFDSTALEPCPFCGDEVEQSTIPSIHYGDSGYMEKTAQFSCGPCNLTFQVIGDNVTKEEAIKRWNTRADLVPRGQVEDRYRSDVLFLIGMGFEHKIENGFHVVKGHGFEYQHVHLGCIAARIKHHFFEAKRSDNYEALAALDQSIKKYDDKRDISYLEMNIADFCKIKTAIRTSAPVVGKEEAKAAKADLFKHGDFIQQKDGHVIVKVSLSKCTLAVLDKLLKSAAGE